MMRQMRQMGQNLKKINSDLSNAISQIGQNKRKLSLYKNIIPEMAFLAFKENKEANFASFFRTQC
jgi:hypothetical protein